MIKINNIRNNNYKENFYYRGKIVYSVFTFTALNKLKQLKQLSCIRNIRANLQEYKKNKKNTTFYNCLQAYTTYFYLFEYNK